jgi:hypothetical protein
VRLRYRVVPSGRANIVDCQRNAVPHALNVRRRVHWRLARRPVAVARAVTRASEPPCVSVIVAE